MLLGRVPIPHRASPRGQHLRVAAGLLAVLMVHASSAGPPPAADPAVDDEFLEFLGSVDSDSSQPGDGWWINYLSRSDAGKARPPSTSAPPANEAKPPEPPKQTSDDPKDGN